MKVGDIVVCVDPIVGTELGGLYRITRKHEDQLPRMETINCININGGQEIRGIYLRRFKISPEYKVKKLLNKLYND